MAIEPEEVGRRIREAREAKDWTHEQLAREMGVSLRTAQRWQEGVLPRLSKLMDLADRLEVPRSFFVEDEDPQVTLREIRERLEGLEDELRGVRQDLAARLPAAPGAAPARRRPKRAAK